MSYQGVRPSLSRPCHISQFRSARLVVTTYDDRTRLGYPSRVPQVVPPRDVPLYNP